MRCTSKPERPPPVDLNIQLYAELLILVHDLGLHQGRAGLVRQRWLTLTGGGDGEYARLGEGGVDLVQLDPGGERETLLELLTAVTALVSGADGQPPTLRLDIQLLIQTILHCG